MRIPTLEIYNALRLYIFPVLIMTLPWKVPFTSLICGPSASGKSSFVLRFLENLPYMIDGSIDRIVWICSPGSEPRTLLPIQFRTEIPSFEEFAGVPTLCIIDDMMNEGAYSKNVCNLFTRGSNHFNISVFLITQNIFYQSPQSRNISLNAKYIVVFKNPRDQLQFGHLARQVYPKNSKELERVYKESTSEPFGYLVLDLGQDTDDRFRFRTKIFPQDGATVIYMPLHDEQVEEQ
jgi:hypothetical protein